MNVNLPTYGSVATLNAKAEKGSSSAGLIAILFSSSRGYLPSIPGTSSGEGKYDVIASNKN